MFEHLPPGTLLIFGGFLFIVLRGRAQKIWLLLLPIVSAIHLLTFETGTLMHFSLFGYELTPIRIDRLSLVWGYIFHISAFLSALFALHVKDRTQHIAAMMYVGSALSAVFAGDLITLFVFWELTAITSVFLIWARKTEAAYRAGMRFLVIQVGSGILLLVGVILRVADGGSLAFDHITSDISFGDPSSLLIFLAFGIKAAFPLLHNWLQDSYPEATVTGTVFLSAFTTKLAIYALARGFAGTEILIWIGAIMTVFPIFFAIIENDLRRVLAYSLNDQLGFMVVGIGIGSALSLNGTAAHAFTHVLYKALLFMSVGAVLFRTGTARGSELGGLYRTMPLTALFCVVGAASISALPLFSGFISKALIISAAAEEHLTVIWLILLFASAGIVLYTGIQVPFSAFFGPDSGRRPKEAPPHMLIAMGITAALCILIGILPRLLYQILPFDLDYHPYTAGHVLTKLQLLVLSALAFIVLKMKRIYPPELPATNLDFDWTYRKLLPQLVNISMSIGSRALERVRDLTRGTTRLIHREVYRHHGPEGVFARTIPTGIIVFWAVLGLGAYLLLYFL